MLYLIQVQIIYICKPFICQPRQIKFENEMIILHPLRRFEPAMPIYRKALSFYQRVHFKTYSGLFISTTQVHLNQA